MSLMSISKWLAKQFSDMDDSGKMIRLVLGSYIGLIILCFLLLLLPFFQTQSHSFIDHLFFSVSIVTTTGLFPSELSETYNFGGQLVVLFFIQVGGIGYMTLISYVLASSFKKLPKMSSSMVKLEFSVPDRYPLVTFFTSAIVFTILFEIIGAVLLYPQFVAEGVDQPIWSAIFHSISAFCTAGFSLYNDSLSQFSDNGMIMGIIIGLSVLGSLGFIIFSDLWLFITRKQKRFSLTSKIIVVSSMAIMFVGFTFLYLSEKQINDNPILEGLNYSFFQIMAAHTTVGFNNFDISSLSGASLFILIIIMVIGAAPTGTGGGIKTTSITTLFAVTKSIIRNRDKVVFFKTPIPIKTILLAVANVFVYLVILIIGTWLITLTDGDNINFKKLWFETSSAIGTVGLSAGITGDLSVMGKIIICLLMYIGRVGALSLGLALVRKRQNPMIFNAEEELAI